MKLKLSFLFLFVFVSGSTLYGQMSIIDATTKTENFDGMGSSATAAFPTGFRVNNAANYSNSNIKTAVTHAAGTLGAGILTSTSAGGNYNFANGETGTATDRAVGFLAGLIQPVPLSPARPDYAPPRFIMLAIKNNTAGGIITKFDITFDYEKYKSGTRAMNWTFTHGSSATFISTPATAGNLAGTADAVNTTVYNPPITTPKIVTVTPAVPIAPGGIYYFCWSYTSVSFNNAQALGLDNVTVTPTVVYVPTVTAPTVTAITTTTATLGATVASDRGGTITSRGTVWGTAAAPTGNSGTTSGTTGVFTTAQTGFTPNTLYTYRGFAVNLAGTGYSEDAYFTSIHNPPTVGAGSGATTTTIDANWLAPTGGGSESFTYEIEVDDDISFGSVNYTENNIPSGTLTTTATGLNHSTFYYYRVRAVNAGGNSEWSAISVGYPTTSLPTDYFRSKNSGDWANASNWESSADKTTWINATLFPTSDSKGINIRNLHTITVASGTITADDLVISAGGTLAISGGTFIVNNGAATTDLQVDGTITYNSGSFNLNDGSALSIGTGGTFDNGCENQIISIGSPSIIISGTFITRDTDGFVGANAAIPRITPTLNSGCTIEYGFAGNQAVQGRTAATYNKITFSGGGTKTLESDNAVTGTISIVGTTVFDAGDHIFGSETSNLTMTGDSVYKLGGSGLLPQSGGLYTLGTASTIEFTGTSATQIRITPSYANIIVSGTNVKAGSNYNDGLTFQNAGTFTVKNNGVFKVTNTDGFSDCARGAIKNTNSPTITLQTGSRIEFAGNQVLPATQTITPFVGYSDVGISGTGTKKLANTTEVYVGRDLLLFPETVPSTSGFLQIDADRLLTVERNIVNTSTKDLVIKNGGNLVQVDNEGSSTGNIKMTRTSRNMQNDLDYVYWGSPVKENVLSQIPSSYDLSYQWDLDGTIDGKWNTLVETSPGRGFITRIKIGETGIKNFDFTGTPNNGIVTVLADCYSTNPDLETEGNTILLANPYPSALDAEDFINANSTILDGSLYFWSSATVFNGRSYTYDDYATWNVVGGVATAPPSVPSDLGLKPSGFVAAGQGFFADIHDDGDIVFNNTMRVRTANQNAHFFKTKNTKQTKADKNRVWLNLTNDENAFRQMLIGYTSSATNGFDRKFDGEAVTDNEVNLYSIVDNKALVIQGRALPFDLNDTVPLGIAVAKAGKYTITIDSVDGILTRQNIYIEDKLLNNVHNLTASPYHFTIEAGIFDTRFVVRYTDRTLGTAPNKWEENQLHVYTKDNQIQINSKLELINTVTVYDILGRQLFNTEKINKTLYSIPHFVSSNQTLLIKIQLQNGQEITKKVVY